MYCSNCGTAGEDGRFCSKCGFQNKGTAEVVGKHVPYSKIENRPVLMMPSGYMANQQNRQMTFGGAISTCFSKFADFSGRANLAEYWWFALFNLLVYVCVLILIFISGLSSTSVDGASAGAVVLFYIPMLILLIPNLSVTIRRLHDAGHPGSYFFFNFIPIIGPFIIFIYALQPSEELDNKYGAFS